jgi:hypothetical protein
LGLRLWLLDKIATRKLAIFLLFLPKEVAEPARQARESCIFKWCLGCCSDVIAASAQSRHTQTMINTWLGQIAQSNRGLT